MTDTVSFREQYVNAFRFMLQARALDEKLASLYRSGKIHGGVFLGKGQEAVSASIGVSLRKGDVFAPTIRDGAGRLAFGESIYDAVRTYLGSVKGPMRGRDGNVHRGRTQDGILPMISHLGAMISVVNGALMARRFKKVTDGAGAVSIGDGCTSTGAFHEALNQAAVEKLPLVLVVTNNQYAYSTPNDRQFACRNLVDKAIGYGVGGHVVDGTDLKSCLRVMNQAVTQAREGGGPQLIVAEILRLCGHGEHDDSHYIDRKLKESVKGRDCMQVAETYVIEHDWLDAKSINIWRREFAFKIEEVVAAVQHEPGPDPYNETWCALASTHLNEVLENP